MGGTHVWTLRSTGLTPQERVTEDVESPRILLSGGAAECINRGADLDTLEARHLHHLLPARTRQATGDSSGPEIDVGDGSLRDRLAVGDIGELQDAARL